MTTTQLRTQPAPEAARESAGQPANPARTGLRNLLLDVGVPVGSYYVARAAGCDLFAALVISSALPLVRTLVALARRQSVDGLALAVLVVNVVSLGISFWSGNPRFMLAKDGAITSVLGVAVLLSVLYGRPLMTAGMRPFVTRGKVEKEAAFDRLLGTSARFNQLSRQFSVVWGIAFLIDCAARVSCAVILPVNTVVWLSTVLSVGCIGLGVLVAGFWADRIEKMVSAEASRA